MARFHGVSIVVLVEDKQLERFVRKVFTAFGIDRRKVRIRTDFPRKGAGSGKQYVDDRYPEEARTLRRKPSENRALLIATEADEQTVEQRIQSLESSLEGSGEPPRGGEESIAYWVPKWHVETWGLHLSGYTDVREEKPCKDRADQIRWNETGKRFVEEYNLSKTGSPLDSLASLLSAYAETARLNP